MSTSSTSGCDADRRRHRVVHARAQVVEPLGSVGGVADAEAQTVQLPLRAHDLEQRRRSSRATPSIAAHTSPGSTERPSTTHLVALAPERPDPAVRATARARLHG